MKFKDLLDSNNNFSIKRKYQNKNYEGVIDFSKCTDTIDDIGDYHPSFVDCGKYWKIAMKLDNDSIYYGYTLENFENHPEIIYEIIKYVRYEKKKRKKKDSLKYLDLYRKLPDKLKLKLELEENKIKMTKIELIGEKIELNEKLLGQYFSTDIQYIEIVEENKNLRRELKILESEILNKIPLSRSDIIDRCIIRGKMFIKHFHKIYQNSKDKNFKYWSGKMKEWFNDVKDYRLKPTNREILDGELRDWFFTAGATYETFIKNANEDEIISYDKFCSSLISNKNDFNGILEKHFNV